MLPRFASITLAGLLLVPLYGAFVAGEGADRERGACSDRQRATSARAGGLGVVEPACGSLASAHGPAPERATAAPDATPHELSGRVVDPEGRPVAAWPLAVVHQRFVGDARSHAELRLAELEQAAGAQRLFAATLTDTAGRFAFADLAPGLYAFSTEPARRAQHGEELYPSGSEGVELVVPLHRVEVVALDEEGRPVREGEAFCVRAGDGWADRPGDLPGAALPVHELDAPGRRTFELQTGAGPLLVGWRSQRHGLVTTRLAALPDEHQSRVVLAHPARRTSGSVALVVRGEDEDAAADLRTTWSVHSPDTGAELRASRGAALGQEHVVSLPAGRWVVRAHELARSGAAVDDTPRHAFAEATVVVRAGESAREELLLPLGGRLRLHVELPDGAELDPLLRAALEATAEERSARVVELYSAPLARECRARVSVPGAAGLRTLVRFCPPAVDGAASSGSRWGAPFALPGFVSLSETLLPEGLHALRVELTGYEALELPVVIRAGEVSDLRVDLSPRSGS